MAVLLGLVSAADRRRHRHRLHHLLIRRNDTTGDTPTYAATAPSPSRCAPWSPAGQRWRMKNPSSRQRIGRPRSAPGSALDLLAPLDHPGHARPRLPGRSHRHRTRHHSHSGRSDRVDVNEFRRLFDALLLVTSHTWPVFWPGHDGDDNTNTEPADATTDDAKTNDPDLRLQY